MWSCSPAASPVVADAPGLRGFLHQPKAVPLDPLPLWGKAGIGWGSHTAGWAVSGQNLPCLWASLLFFPYLKNPV